MQLSELCYCFLPILQRINRVKCSHKPSYIEFGLTLEVEFYILTVTEFSILHWNILSTHFFHHIRSANGLENNESSLSRLIRNGAGHYQIRCTYITYNYPLYLAYDGSGQLIRCSGINQKTVLRLQWDAKSRTVSIFSPLLSKFLSFRNLPKPRLVFDSDFSNLYESKFELQLGIVDSAIRICPYGGSWGPIVFDPKNNNAIITQKIDTTIYQSNFYLESATKSQIEASYSK